LIYLSLYITEGDYLKLNFLINLPVLLSILAGLIISLANFKLSEIKNALKVALSDQKLDIESINNSKKIIKHILKTIISALSVNFVLIFITMLLQTSVAKIGPYLAILFVGFIYLITLKLFIFMPLEISLDKKIAKDLLK
ncbi:MAG: hypothetical protein H7263_16970, partial [Candidatus Sericytochromatia bacterium]|nr:hypothetical protein [Candidatus Sericytochromatia bacterium]